MKKILVVFTGGTIASKAENATVNLDENAGTHLLELFESNYKVEVEFDTIQPFHILSENCEPFYWGKLLDALQSIDTKKYSGIIITHGTDTLSYTAAFLGLMLYDIDIPIVITGSNYPLNHKKSVGLANFFNSVMFINQGERKGIYTIFQDQDGRNMVYLATRVREADSYLDQFSSYGGSSLGEIINGSFHYNKNEINPSEEALQKQENTNILNKSIVFKHSVFAVQAYPGLNYQYIQFEEKPKAILHSLYHSGTGSIENNEYSLPRFIERCVSSGIDFYLISFHNLESDLYETSRELLKYGAIPLQNISFEAAYAKLNIAYNQEEMDPQEYMKKEWYFEFLPIQDESN
jgi:L-asparaginase/archaeal Glu-tRNAGln amidotransferase subunit D